MRVAAVWVPDRALRRRDDQLKIDAPRDSGLRHRAVARRGSRATLLPELVIVTDSEHLGHRGLNELTWDLEKAGVDLMVSPNVVHVSNGRLNLTTVASMPLLHIAEPQYAAAAAWPS